MSCFASGHTVEREGNLLHLGMMELSFILFAIMSHGMITISLHMFSKTSGKTNFDILSADISKESEKKKRRGRKKKKNPVRKNYPTNTKWNQKCFLRSITLQ